MQTTYPARILPHGSDTLQVEVMVGNTWRAVGRSRNRATANSIRRIAMERLPMAIVGECVQCGCVVKDKLAAYFSDSWVFCNRACHDKYQMEIELGRLLRRYPKRSFLWRLLMAWRMVRGSRGSRKTAYKIHDAFT